MATLKQFEANRRNAQMSTGPKTTEGKAAVSMNALRHGLRARTVVLPGENREEFNQLCDDLEIEWHPQSRTEQFYVEQMAVSQWKLTRMEVSEVNLSKIPIAPRINSPYSTVYGKPSAAWSAPMPEHNASWSAFKTPAANRTPSPTNGPPPRWDRRFRLSSRSPPRRPPQPHRPRNHRKIRQPTSAPV
jgi:hypothetical protein